MARNNENITRSKKAKLKKILDHYQGGGFPIHRMPAPIFRKILQQGGVFSEWTWKMIRSYFDAAGLITQVEHIGFRAWFDRDGNYCSQNYLTVDLGGASCHASRKAA